MVVGQRARLECAARFAFGSKGRPAVQEGDRALTPDSDVIFVVELIALGNALPAGSLSTEQRIEEAQRKRENGNIFSPMTTTPSRRSVTELRSRH